MSVSWQRSLRSGGRGPQPGAQEVAVPEDGRAAAPPWRAAWPGALGWLLVALAVRTGFAAHVTHPGYIDSY